MNKFNGTHTEISLREDVISWVSKEEYMHLYHISPNNYIWHITI